MRLTFEEASIVRELIQQYPAEVPRDLLSLELRSGNIERVARMCSVYHHRRIHGGVDFYVLALIKSGTYQDISLAITLLTEEYGTEAIHDPQSYITAAKWISRFDLNKNRAKKEDLGQRLHTLAAISTILNSGEQSEECLSKLQIAIQKGVEKGMTKGDARAFISLYWVKNHCLDLAFGMLKKGIAEEPGNPYLRMTAHKLFRAVNENNRMDVLLYRKDLPPVLFGISAIHGTGVLCKEYTGEGFGRNKAGMHVDDNYSEILFLEPEALKTLEPIPFKRGRVEPQDANWGKWLLEKVGRRRESTFAVNAA